MIKRNSSDKYKKGTTFFMESNKNLTLRYNLIGYSPWCDGEGSWKLPKIWILGALWAEKLQNE